VLPTLLKVIYPVFFFTRIFFSCLAIGKAFSVLSDAKKRQDYDQYGQAMEPQNHRGANTGGRQRYYYCDEDDDFSAEEIFNIFFGHAGMT